MAEFLDVVVGVGILAQELVAGETDHGEGVGVGGLDFLVEGFEAFELWGETAFRGGVDNEAYFACKVFERVRIALFLCGRRVSLCSYRGDAVDGLTVSDLEVVERGCGAHLSISCVGKDATKTQRTSSDKGQANVAVIYVITLCSRSSPNMGRRHGLLRSFPICGSRRNVPIC